MMRFCGASSIPSWTALFLHFLFALHAYKPNNSCLTFLFLCSISTETMHMTRQHFHAFKSSGCQRVTVTVRRNSRNRTTGKSIFFCCLNIVQLEPRHADRITPHISRPPLFHAPGILFYTHLAVIKHEALGIFRISVTFGRVWSAFLWVWMELRGRSSHQKFM